MTEEQAELELFRIYESEKNNILDRIERIFRTSLEIESIFNEFIYLDSFEIEQIYSHIWNNLEDFTINNLPDPELKTENILCSYDWYEKGSYSTNIIAIQIIFSDKFIKVVEEILNERDMDYELRNFGF